MTFEDKRRRVKLADWHAEGIARFGENPLKWKFVCPSCGMVQTAEDWKGYGIPFRDVDRQVGFNCIGRRILSVCPTADVVEFGDMNKGFGCNYTGGGLFRVNPVEVEFGFGAVTEIRETFEWAPS